MHTLRQRALETDLAPVGVDQVAGLGLAFEITPLPCTQYPSRILTKVAGYIPTTKSQLGQSDVSRLLYSFLLVFAIFVLTIFNCRH
jgi:hypothetical protein